MTVLITLVAIKLIGLTFNLMTLGGIAAAIGLVIDDAIVVVEAVHTKLSAGINRVTAVESAIGELFKPLVASTLTPVVVFIPLAFLDGITGVFFRALAMTMVVALLTSLVLAVTMTPSLAVWLMRVRRDPTMSEGSMEGGAVLGLLIRIYEVSIRVVAAPSLGDAGPLYHDSGGRASDLYAIGQRVSAAHGRRWVRD